MVNSRFTDSRLASNGDEGMSSFFQLCLLSTILNFCQILDVGNFFHIRISI